jgi:transcription initiation factor IIF auxiliary subunit
VFNEPTEAFRDILAKHNALQPNLPTKKPASLPQFSVQLEQEELARLDAAQKEVNAQIVSLKQRMAALDQD